MDIKRIPAGIYAANCYVVMDESTKEAVVMDPGGDVDDIMNCIDKFGAKVKYILLTHGHLDHTGGIKELRSKLNVPVCINEKDEILMRNNEYMFGKFDKDDENIFIKENDIIKFGKKQIKCIETPGHTPGGMSFYVDNFVFTGDSLFRGSIGRTDLFGGDYDALINSLKEKIITLPGETIVYSGHGPETSINLEKEHNPFL